MSEIKKEPIHVYTTDGVPVDAFSPSHTISDIIRYAIKESDWEEVNYIVQQEKKSNE